MVLSLLSLNVRGFKNVTKRKAIFLYCKAQVNVNCFFFQETHSSEEDFDFWKSQWGSGNIYLSHGSPRSAGVAIFLHNFDGKIVDHKSDTEGHWLMVNIEVDDTKYILVNIYGFNNRTKNQKFLTNINHKIINWKQMYATDKIIVAGDFNVVPDENQDRYPTQHNSPHFNKIISEFSNSLDLIDIWRRQNPNKLQYTWNNSQHSQRSRIDYWLVTSNLTSSTLNCNISHSPLTDHCAITLALSPEKNQPKNGTSHWKFNNSLVNDKNFCKKIKSLIPEIKEIQYLSPINRWEWLKFNIRKIAIVEGKILARKKRQEQTEIISKLTTLCNLTQLSEENVIEVNKLQSKLDELYTEKAKGAFIRSKAKWMEDGEKNSTYFFNLEKSRQRKKTITKLQIENSLVDDQNNIKDYITNFYKNLYTSQYSYQNTLLFERLIYDKVPKIDKTFRDLMESELTIDELDKAVSQMASGKSPGPDGITAEFYKHFWTDIREMLFEAFNECIDEQMLSPTMKRGIISLLPKPGKDVLLIDNWRPITLLCCDYKILAHIYANRLKSGISQIIDESQSAFIKGRHIHHHTRLILDILDYIQIIPQESLILFLDFFKAFDSLEHAFLFNALKTFGFESKFCNIIKMFYKDISSNIALNRGFSNSFPVNRGVRQGCPISPLLFIISAELLAIFLKYSPDFEGINIFDREFKISQFADDTALFLKNKNMVPVVINKILLFSRASGLTLNLKKCEILPIHTCNQSIIENIPVKSEVKYLGLIITKNSNDRESVNITPRLKTIQKTLNQWLGRGLSIFGRILLSKAEGFSRLVYPCHSLYTSPKNIKLSNSILFKFIWKNKTHYIRKSQLVRDYKNGGLKALDVESQIVAFRMKWLKGCISQPHSMWYHIPNKLFGKVGGLEFLLKCDYNISKVPIKLSNFYKQALEFGKMPFNHNFSPHNTVLWNNRFITVNKKSLFMSERYGNGVYFVHDLMRTDGRLLSYYEFVTKHKIKDSSNCYNKVCKAIPIPLLNLIQNILQYNEIKPQLSELKINNIPLKDKKCNNKLITLTFKQLIFCNFSINNRCDLETTQMNKSFSLYTKYPLPPKMKETHFKIISKIYPVGDFLHKRFKFESEPCIFCSSETETLEHLFYSCNQVKIFWSDIHNWLSLKILNIPFFSLYDVLFYMENLDPGISDVINVVIILCKHFIHLCKWKNTCPLFSIFLNYFSDYYKCLKCIPNKNKKTTVIYQNISKVLLF
uniref:Reverse transcriptase domain-containing protein n=1 Tax=Oryzias latipes TaxID=8090 RepID=A0A3B3HKX7_ORYLA